jgi:hypothetical protein
MKDFMKITLGFVSGWVAVTFIYTTSLFIESGTFHWGFLVSVAFVVGVYSIVLGIPAFLLFKGIKLSGTLAFIYTGLVASIPMLVYCLYQAEFGYAVSTIVSGAAFGFIFSAIYQPKPNKQIKRDLGADAPRPLI